MLFLGEYIQDNVCKLFSELAEFCKRCDKTFWFDLFPVAVPIDVHLQNANAKFDNVV